MTLSRSQPDIVERLRVWPAAYGEDAFNSTYVGLIMKQAAEIIEQYRADQQHDEQLINELRAAPARCDAVNARAAVIEECAKVAEAQAQTFLSPQYASNQPFGSICERFACEEVAKAIRALAIPSADRWITCPICNGDCVVFPDGGGCEKCDGVGRLAVTSTMLESPPK